MESYDEDEYCCEKDMISGDCGGHKLTEFKHKSMRKQAEPNTMKPQHTPTSH